MRYKLNTKLQGTVTLEANEVRELLKQLRTSTEFNSDWDLNLVEGQMAETALKEILCGEHKSATIEVKRDFQAADTGNIAIEFEQRGHPSGIATTKAVWWAYCLGGGFDDELTVIIKTEKLRKILSELDSKYVRTNVGKQRVGMFLLPLSHLFSKG